MPLPWDKNRTMGLCVYSVRYGARQRQRSAFPQLISFISKPRRAAQFGNRGAFA
jgi:hypothetical protein